MKILGGWTIFWTFLTLYLWAIRLILIWLAQFPAYPILFNLALVSLVVVMIAGVLFWWSDDLDERSGVADIALVLARPFMLYLSAVAGCLYAIALMVGAVLLLPFSLFWPRKRT